MPRLQLLLADWLHYRVQPKLIAADAASPPKLRVLIETDAGGDPDDEQSLVRFLLYTNEWDVEGILCTRPQTKRDENRNKERRGSTSFAGSSRRMPPSMTS